MLRDSSRAKPPWFTALFLIGATVWLLMERPGQLAYSGPHRSLILISVIFSAIAAYLTAWTNHGWIFGILAFFLCIESAPALPESLTEARWQFDQALFLACLGIHLIFWTLLDKNSHSLVCRSVGAIGLIAISTLVWIAAVHSSDEASALINPQLTLVGARMRNCTLALMLAGGALAFSFSGFKRGGARKWAGISFLAPPIGLGIANLFVPARPNHLFDASDWGSWLADADRWIRQPDLLATMAGWCWSTPLLVAPLMAIGVWRASARGFKQRRHGLPTAWLVLLAAILLLAALIPGPAEHSPAIGLIWTSVALSVFAAGDLILLLFEQLALPAPETGPSKVPHV